MRATVGTYAEVLRIQKGARGSERKTYAARNSKRTLSVFRVGDDDGNKQESHLLP